VLLIAEVTLVLLLDAIVITHGRHLSTALLHPSQVASGSLGIAITFAVASFLGFEATAVFRDEARDPARSIPRATYAALLLITAFYTLSSWSLVSAQGDAVAVEAGDADPGRMVVTTFSAIMGAAGGDVAHVLLTTNLFAAILSIHNVLARYLFALGNTGALPESFGRSHARHASPHVASLTQVITALVLLVIFALAGLNPVTQLFTWMAGTATLGVLLLMALTCAAVLVFFRRHRADTRTWHTVAAPVLGFGGLLVCLWLTIANFPTLIGDSSNLAAGIEAVLVLAFVLGARSALVAGPSARPGLPRPPRPRPPERNP
jgi:amino acid transporter